MSQWRQSPDRAACGSRAGMPMQSCVSHLQRNRPRACTTSNRSDCFCGVQLVVPPFDLSQCDGHQRASVLIDLDVRRSCGGIAEGQLDTSAAQCRCSSPRLLVSRSLPIPRAPLDGALALTEPQG